MATIHFPASLNRKKPLVDSFSLTQGSGKVETQFLGQLLSRRSPFKANDIMPVAFHYTREELDTFKTFYDQTLNGGVESFRYTHPIYKTAVDVKIFNEPTFDAIGPTDFRVNMNFVIVDENP